MKKRFLLVAALSFSLLFAHKPNRANAQDTNLIKEIKKSVVAIEISKDQLKGAGFLITKQGHILTAKHVIDFEKALRVYVKFDGDSEHRTAQILNAHPIFDLAYLKIDDRNLPSPAKFGDSASVVQGEPLTIIGHPMKEGQEYRYEAANLSVKSINERGCILLGGDLSPGFSGGPAFNSKGQVIGIAFATHPVIRESYVFPVQYLQHFLLSVGIDVGPGGTGEYISQFAKLKMEFDNLQKIINWMKVDLKWNVDLKEFPVARGGKKGAEKKLKIGFEKRFAEQFIPEKIGIKIYPRFRYTDIDLRDGLIVQIEKNFSGETWTELGDIEGSIRGWISGYNEAKKMELKYEDVRKLDVLLKPLTEDRGVIFPQTVVTLEYP